MLSLGAREMSWNTGQLHVPGSEEIWDTLLNKLSRFYQYQNLCAPLECV